MSKKSTIEAEVQGKNVELPTKQSLLAAKELAAQVKVFAEGEDIEEHLRRLDDMSELMMVEDLVKYQATLLSMDETTRDEFNAWLKSENLKEEVRGKPDALKKRLLEKFRVRKSLLERINFIIQPRRRERRLIVDLLERRRIYEEVYAEISKNREKLMVEAAMQLLSPDDRADFGNLRPDEAKRDMSDLIEFVRRKEEERLREKKLGLSKNEEDKEEEEKKSFLKRRFNKEDEERDRLMTEGRCFICHKVGHLAADCPDNPKKNDPKKNDDESAGAKLGSKKMRRRSGANSF